nr:hypothetical protein CFP56_79560 [Quercus suber]
MIAQRSAAPLPADQTICVAVKIVAMLVIRIRYERSAIETENHVLTRFQQTSQAQPCQTALKRLKKPHERPLHRPGRSEPGPTPQDPSPASESFYELRWAVKCIVSKRRIKGKLFYKVKWEDTWEPAESLQGCAEIAISEF